MRALALDCAASRFAVALKDGQDMAKLVFDSTTSGKIKLSAKLLPAIDSVMKELALTPKDLEAAVVTAGPGSFTGLRVGLSALKALTFAYDTPVYAVPTLDALAYPYRNAIEIVIPVIESRRDKFFHAIFMRGQKVSSEDDLDVCQILAKVDSEADILVCGQAAPRFAELCLLHSPLRHVRFFAPENDATDSLFEIAEWMIARGDPPLEESSGSLYCAQTVYTATKPQRPPCMSSS